MRYFICLLLITSQSYAFEILFPLRLKTKLNTQYLNDVLIYSYNRVKVDAKIVYVKEQEINKRIKNGNFDAIASKIDFPELSQVSNKVVPPLIKNYRVSLWKGAQISNKEKYRVGVIKGVVAYDNAIEKNKSLFSSVNYYKKYHELLAALDRNEIDAILLSQLALEYNIPLDLKYSLKEINSNLYTTDLNHFVHKKHKDLERKLSRQFSKLQRKKKLDLMDYYFNVFIPSKIK